MACASVTMAELEIPILHSMWEKVQKRLAINACLQEWTWSFRPQQDIVIS